MLFAALATVVIGLLVTSRFQRREAPAPDDETPSPPGAAWRFVEPLLWIALYVLLAEWLGFLLTAGALLLVYLVRLGTRPRIAFPIALLIVPAAYYVFGVLLRVGLPRGMLGW